MFGSSALNVRITFGACLITSRMPPLAYAFLIISRRLAQPEHPAIEFHNLIQLQIVKSITATAAHFNDGIDERVAVVYKHPIREKFMIVLN